MAITDLTGTTWQFNDVIAKHPAHRNFKLNAVITSGDYSITIPYQVDSYYYDQITLHNNKDIAPTFRFATYDAGSTSYGQYISYFAEGDMMIVNGNYNWATVAGWRYNNASGGGVNYETSVKLSVDSGIIPAPMLTITGGADATNAELIAYLEANAVQIIKPKAKIFYNGNEIASIESGQTATLSCSGKVMKDDIVIKL